MFRTGLSRDRRPWSYHVVMDTTTFDPEDLTPADRYKLLSGLVVPRPIGWIGSVSSEGIFNLAPYSFFNVIAANPPTVLFSAGRRGGELKDTAANVLVTGEFTVNIVTEATAKAMNISSGDHAPEINEFELAGLTAVRGQRVGAPRVLESAASLECALSHWFDLGDPPTNRVFVGDVVFLHVRDEVLDGTRVNHQALRAVGRLAGSDYVTTADALFTMDRPD